MERYLELIQRAQSNLEEARTALIEEITAYPMPIAGCDAQFNHLLDQRQRVVGALAQLVTKRDDS